MKITKKFLSILLATILILSAFPVSLAYATDNPITFYAQADAESAKAGDIVSVDVCMSENSAVAALTLVVDYDNTALKILNVQSKQAFGYEEFNTAFDGNKLAYLTASANPKTVGGTLFTVQFEVLKEGCAEISLTVNELTDIDFKTLSSSTQSTKVHNYDNGTVTPPTCTEQGYTTYACECGDSYVADYVNATGHSFGNWTTEITPTCTETGFEKRVCSACGETETNEFSATGHDYDHENGVLTRPTETEKGFYTYTCKNDISHITTEEVESADYTEYNKVARKLEEYLSNSNITSEAKSYIMAECVNIMRNNAELYNFSSLTERRDLIASEQYIVDKATKEFNEFFQVVDSVIANCESGNHDVRAYISNDNATCTVNGTKRGACYYCGSEVIVDDENNPALGHDIVVDNAVAPDCVNTGLTEGSHCSRCDDATTEQEVVPALGHSYNPVVTPPTCTEGGYTTYTCTVCDDSYIDDETSATGHSYTSEITKPATHTENGEMTFTCACGDTYTETINATGDHFYTPAVTSPTCTEGGYTTYTCVCGDTYVADETSATGHDYDYENGVLMRPTETTSGCYVYFCKNDTSHTIFESVESADYTEYDKAIEKLNEYLADSNLTDEAKKIIVSGCVEIIQNNDEFYEDGIRERRDLIASEQHIIDKVTNELNEHYQAVDSIIASCESGNHDVKEYVSDNNATCTVNGTKRGACYYCGTEVIADDENNPASGHDIVVDNAVAPDCVNTGLTEGSHCSRCDGATTEQEVVPALGHSYQNGICTVCDYADPDYFVFSVKAPSITKIRNKDGIILHAEVEGKRPEGSYVEWTVDNGNFDKTAMNNGDELRVIANNKGYTTFTATLYDADGNELAKDTVELYSQSGFFDKIGGIFRSLFGTTKIYEN